MRSDDQLVALFRMGYDEAFRTIHDRYRQRLFAYTRQMLGGARSDAEDVLQDVFLRAYGALRNDDRPVTLRAWLYRVAHNRCVDQLRRPVPAAAEVYELSRPPQYDPPGETERREDLRDLVRDVQRLPEQQRSALLMRELDGLSYAELADALRTSVPSIKSLLVRARLGLVEAGEARDTACAEIRAEIALAHGRGVRVSGRSRRHLRDCSACREYRHTLRGVGGRFAALGGGGPLATLAKLLGIGGASSGAAAGAGAGGSAALVGGATAATATKVAAIVGCAAVVGGGAVEVRQHVTAVKPPHRSAVHARAAAAAARPAPAQSAVVRLTAPVARRSDPLREDAVPAKLTHKRDGAADHGGATAPAGGDETPAASTPVADGPAAAAPAAAASPEEAQTGGSMAPDEDTLPDPSGTGGDGAPDAPAPEDPAAAAPVAGTEQPTAPLAPLPPESGAPVTG